ncbi:hypothetical protein FB462_3304 [Curtobacterium citreum]|nr:hypothetical protein FB462_3304 [Curtobacterium citreum]
MIPPNKDVPLAFGRHGLVDVLIRRPLTGGGEAVTNSQKNGGG